MLYFVTITIRQQVACSFEDKILCLKLQEILKGRPGSIRRALQGFNKSVGFLLLDIWSCDILSSKIQDTITPLEKISQGQ